MDLKCDSISRLKGSLLKALINDLKLNCTADHCPIFTNPFERFWEKERNKERIYCVFYLLPLTCYHQRCYYSSSFEI